MLQFSTSALACTTFSSVSTLLCSSSFVIVYITRMRINANASYLDYNGLLLVILLVLLQPINLWLFRFENQKADYRGKRGSRVTY